MYPPNDQPYSDAPYAGRPPSWPPPSYSTGAQPVFVNTPPPPSYTNVYVQPPRKVNHLLHAVLTALSCGLWAPVWIIDAVRK